MNKLYGCEGILTRRETEVMWHRWARTNCIKTWWSKRMQSGLKRCEWCVQAICEQWLWTCDAEKMSKHQTNCDYFSAHTKNAWKIRIERKLRKNQQTCAEFSAKTNFWIEQWTSSLFPCLKLKPVVYFASFQNSCWDFSENFWIIKATQIILNSALKQLVAREIRKLVLNCSIVSFNLNCYLSQGHHLLAQLKSVEFCWASGVAR